MPSMLTEQVQLGFDIATSVTIIGALISWSLESRRRASKERQLGLNEQARVASLEKVQTILSEFETSFSDMVQSCTQFTSPIRRRVNTQSESPFAALERYLTNRPGEIDKLVESLEQIRHHVDIYYEAIQKRRYSLVPVLDSLSGGEKFLTALQQDIREIGHAHDSINTGYVALLKEFHQLTQYANSLLESAPQDVEDSEKVDLLMNDGPFISRSYALLADADYDKWVDSFVPSGKEPEFRERRDNNTLTDNTQLLVHININLAGNLIRNQQRLYAQILWLACKQVSSAQVECKDILIKLSALTHKLMANNEETQLEDIIKLYESDEYFGRTSSVR